MQIQDFVKVYQDKSDEELIQLAAAPQQLTPDARLALQGELSKRAISVADHSEASKSGGHGAGRSTASERVPKGDGQHEGVGDFVAEVLRTYHCHFWLFFKIIGPAVIISTFALITGRNEGREIARHLPRGFDLLAHRAEFLEIWLANSSAWFVSWMAFSFGFGAICIAVEEITSGFTPSAWHSFLHIRERLGPFLRVCLLLLVLLLVVEVVAALLVTGLLWVLHQWKVHPTGFLIWVISYGFVSLGLLVFSRFALAVPAVLLDDCRVGQAMYRSDDFTQGKWLTLAALLAKSLVGGYVAAMWPFWLASFIRVSAPLPSWFPWILTAASMIGVTVVEPTMFVGFALLYLKRSAVESAPSQDLVANQFKVAQ